MVVKHLLGKRLTRFRIREHMSRRVYRKMVLSRWWWVWVEELLVFFIRDDILLAVKYISNFRWLVRES